MIHSCPDCPDCFYHKVRSISFSPTVTPQTLMEKRWARDMPSYARLRANGTQPPSIDGCAELESIANSQADIEMAHALRGTDERGNPNPLRAIPKPLVAKINEANAITRDIDWRPKESVESVKDKYHRGA